MEQRRFIQTEDEELNGQRNDAHLIRQREFRPPGVLARQAETREEVRKQKEI